MDDDANLTTNNCTKVACFCCRLCKLFYCESCKEEHGRKNDEIIHKFIEIPICKPNSSQIECETHRNFSELANQDIDHGIDMEKIDNFQAAVILNNMEILNDYLLPFTKMEEELCSIFDSICTHIEKDFDASQSEEPIKEILKWDNLKTCIEKENINYIIAQNIFFKHRNVSFTQSDIFGSHPLGEFVISDESLQDATYFSFSHPEPTERFESLRSLLLEKVKELYCFQKNYIFAEWNGTGDISIPPPDFMGETHLCRINEVPKEELLNILKRESVQELDSSGFEYVESLIENNDQDFFKLLIAARPNVLEMRGGEWDGTPTIIAAQYDKLELLRFLLGIVHNDDFDRDGDSILSHAAYYGSRECTVWLCESEYSRLINAPNRDGRTPIYWAVYMCISEVVRILCQHNADLRMEDKLGQSPLDLAITNDYVSCENEIRAELQRREERGVTT